MALSLAWVAALVERGLALGWDEIEFFRATRWVSEGGVPFRDFWEHHLPLQWFLFAPVARLFGNGAGADAIVGMRWAQVALWIAAMVILWRIARVDTLRDEGDAWGRWMALAFLLASPTFVEKAIEYRVDVPGNLAFLGAIALVGMPSKTKKVPARWCAFGALMSAAVLSNMRLAPLVIAAAALMLFWRPDQRRWGWNGRALWMAAGVAVVVAAYLAYVAATRSMPGLIEDAIRYNVAPGREKLEVSTFWITLIAPVLSLDVNGVVYWIAGIMGLLLALREIRRPGILQVMGILVVASIATIATFEVQYPYHFQNPMLLLFPLAASALASLRPGLWRGVAVAVAAAGLVIAIVGRLPGFGEGMAYQDRVMTAVDRFTLPGENVFDGVGYALRREPAYRYWFLPTGLRMMAADRLVEPYDLAQIASHPPAAVIFDYRLYLWMEIFPGVREFAVTHYVPLYRNLWIPGMTATIEPRPKRFVWRAVRAGRYDVWTSDLLAKHPWLNRPFEYATTLGPRALQFEIPLERLPPYDAASLQWRVDGKLLPPGARTLDLKRDSEVELIGWAPAKAGVLVVPHGVTRLCMATGEELVF